MIRAILAFIVALAVLIGAAPWVDAAEYDPDSSLELAVKAGESGEGIMQRLG
jgi:hypothetical protein